MKKYQDFIKWQHLVIIIFPGGLPLNTAFGRISYPKPRMAEYASGRYDRALDEAEMRAYAKLYT
jgi:hypothetical protein